MHNLTPWGKYGLYFVLCYCFNYTCIYYDGLKSFVYIMMVMKCFCNIIVIFLENFPLLHFATSSSIDLLFTELLITHLIISINFQITLEFWLRTKRIGISRAVNGPIRLVSIYGPNGPNFSIHKFSILRSDLKMQWTKPDQWLSIWSVWSIHFVWACCLIPLCWTYCLVPLY